MPAYRSLLTITAVFPLALAGCAPEGEEAEDTTYEAGVEDVGGGELQVADPKPGDVEVDLPETPMKNVPVQDDGEGGEEAGSE